MRPEQLTLQSFNAYPAEARRLAEAQLALLRRLPLSFVPLLLRELVVYGWKFPAERRELDRQFEYLSKLTPSDFTRAMAGFSQLRLSPALERIDWVASPASFSEQLTAHLWATHQIDGFRAAAVEHLRSANAGASEAKMPVHRLGVVVIGSGAMPGDYPLFQKLAPHGVHFTNVEHANGLKVLADALSARAAAHPEPYGHWWIDGGAGMQNGGKTTHISYGALSAVRAALQTRMQRTYESAVFDPEAFRTMLARIQPDEIGLNAAIDPVLSRFQLSVLTEGSGTQVFSTTFVQWTAREALRRAQPFTLFARFTPRQREKPMNELLAERQNTPELDPRGSLIDADQGAYYTWMNQQRLTGAEEATFLVWLEDREQAMAISPAFERGKVDARRIGLPDLIARLA